MSKVLTKPIKYKIYLVGDISDTQTLREVDGLALDYPFDARVCARKTEKGIWQIDDFDTGTNLWNIGLRHENIETLIDLGSKIIPIYIENGLYKERKNQVLASLACLLDVES